MKLAEGFTDEQGCTRWQPIDRDGNGLWWGNDGWGPLYNWQASPNLYTFRNPMLYRSRGKAERKAKRRNQQLIRIHLVKDVRRKSEA